MIASSEISEQILRFLIESGVQALLLVPLILAIQYLAGHRLSPAIKHAMWFVVIVRLSAPVFPESPFSLFNVAKLPNFTTNEISVSKQGFERKNINETQSSSNDSSVGDAAPLNTPQENAPSVPVSSPATNLEPELTEGPAKLAFTPSEWLLLAWSLGAIVLFSKLARSWIHYAAIVRRATPIKDQDTKHLVYECMRLLRLKRAPSVIESNEIGAPAVFGMLRPVLLLPESTNEFYSRKERQHIILHELSHIRRLDPIWNLWATLIQIIHWPNPAVWYAIARQRGDRELATDYLALKSLGAQQAKDYGATILKALESISRQRAIPGLIGIADDRTGLKRRFSMIATFRSSRRYSAIVLAAVMFPLLLIGLTDPQTQPSETPAVLDEVIETKSDLAGNNPQRTNESNTASGSREQVLQIQVIERTTNKPVPYISIDVEESWWSEKTQTSRERSQTLTTNSKGTAKAVHLDPDSSSTRIRVQTPGFVAQEKQFIRRYQALPNNYVFKLDRGTEIVGYVKDEAGTPVPDVEVTIQIRSQELTATQLTRVIVGKTNKQGRWFYQGIPKDCESVTIEYKHPRLALASEKKPAKRWRQAGQHPIDRLPSQRKPMKGGDRPAIQTTLSPGGQIRGQIVSEFDQPIAGARIRWFGSYSSFVKADQQGQFEFPGSYAGPITLQVTATGYAPKLVDLNIRPESGPIKVRLHPGNKISFKVVGTNGDPVPNTAIIGMRWNKTGSWLAGDQGRTNENGEYVWTSAPPGPVDFIFHSEGYIDHQQNRMTPRTEPYLVALEPAFVTEFNVTNAKGERIDVFDLHVGRQLGHPRYTEADIQWNPKVSKNFQSQWKFTDTQTFDDGQAIIPNKFIYRIDVPGYALYETRVIDLSESPVSLNIELTRDETNQGFLTNAEGQFIQDESFVLFSPQDEIKLWKGQRIPDAKSLRLKTNRDGHFRVPKQSPDRWLLAALDEGFALLPYLRTEKSQTIALAPWGSLSGRLLKAGLPVKYQLLGYQSKTARDAGVTALNFTDRATSDNNGQFSFTHLPPGEVEIFTIPDRSANLSAGKLIATLNIAAGKNLTTDIGLHQ